MAEQSKGEGTGFSFQTPGYDFTTMLQQFKIPGVDFAQVVERERKNIEALTEANRVAFEGWQNLVRRQGEVLQESMKRAVAESQQPNALKSGVEIATQAFQSALGNMRELAETAVKGQGEAFETIRKRVGENIDALRGDKKS